VADQMAASHGLRVQTNKNQPQQINTFSFLGVYSITFLQRFSVHFLFALVVILLYCYVITAITVITAVLKDLGVAILWGNGCNHQSFFDRQLVCFDR